jgi:hypothetical protein
LDAPILAGVSLNQIELPRQFSVGEIVKEANSLNIQTKELEMAESKFWRTLAAAFVAGIFYLAHGLHDSGSVDSFPSLTQAVQAGDVATATSGNSSLVKIITSSDDGRVINVWSTTTNNSDVKFIGSYTAK